MNTFGFACLGDFRSSVLGLKRRLLFVRVFLFPFAFVPDDVAGWMLSIQVAESKIAASCTAHDADPILHASQSHCAVDSLGKRFGLHGRPIKVFQRAVRVAEASVCLDPRSRPPATSDFRTPLPLCTNVLRMPRV